MPVFNLLQHSRWLPSKWRHFRVTSGDMRSRDAISCHVTVSCCKLQLCRKLNLQYMPVFSPLQRLQVTSGQMTSLFGHFRSHELTSRHLLSRNWSSCKLQPCRKRNVQYTPVFGFLLLIPGDFQSNYVTSKSLNSNLRSRDMISRHVTASFCELQPCRKSNVPHVSFRLSTATSRWLPLKWRNFRVTFGHLRSCHVISCHVTAFSCELQPCRRWNVRYMPIFGVPQPLPGNFRQMT